MADADKPRASLDYFRHMHRDNNQMLHSTSTSLLGTAREKNGALWLDAGVSIVWVGIGLTAALWCYLQTVTLVWDHFDLFDRDELGALETEVLIPVTHIDAADAKVTGRNDLCPCGSGRKYKRCHGA